METLEFKRLTELATEGQCIEQCSNCRFYIEERVSTFEHQITGHCEFLGGSPDFMCTSEIKDSAKEILKNELD